MSQVEPGWFQPWLCQVQLWLPVVWLQQPACVARSVVVPVAPEPTCWAPLESLWDVQAGDGSELGFYDLPYPYQQYIQNIQ